MKKYIIKKIKQTIEDKKDEWAKNYVALKYQETLGTPEAQAQVDSAKFNMETIDVTIGFLKRLLKEEEKCESSESES